MVDNTETAKTIGDVLSITTVIGTLAQVLPSMAAIISIVWTSIRIYETKTVQAWLRRLRG